jgi:protein-S-isoprenylcysteine O-methyltransferase Ste14
VTSAEYAKAALWLVLMGVLLFVPAGTIRWLNGWIFLAEFLLGAILTTTWLARHDPGLFKERMGGVVQRGQAPADKIFMAVLLVTWHGWLILMALDAGRWRLSHVPPALNAVGGLLIAIGFFLIWLVFRENSFAAPVVKIQEERGQHVVSTGPYRFVRHPMYVGGLIYMLGMPLLLGSWLGLVALPLIAGALLTRISIEEATLKKELPGYVDYTNRVRYRLIPGVW